MLDRRPEQGAGPGDRQGFIEREPERRFHGQVALEAFRVSRRVERNMLLVTGEVDDSPVVLVEGDAVAQRLLGFGRGGIDDLPQAAQMRLRVFRRSRDVAVDATELCGT